MIRIADVGAPGTPVQLLPSRLQVPLHPAKAGWGIGRLNMEKTTEWTSGTSRAIMAGLRERVRPVAIRRRDRVEEHVGRYWISWRSRNRNRVFAEIRALQGRVQVFILPGPRDLRDSAGLARRAPPTQGWDGSGRGSRSLPWTASNLRPS